MTYLANVDKETFWAHKTWPSFANRPDREETVVILPFVGFADWGLGHPLDIEETVSLAVLKCAVQGVKSKIPIQVVPPLRFVLGPYANCAFSIEPETAYQFIEEVVHSIHLTGFKKVVLYNSSPWNEELINKACARDLRIKYGMQMFSVNLYGLGLDFHPIRSTSRKRLQTLGTHLLDKEPNLESSVNKTIPVDGLTPGDAISASALNESLSLEQAHRKGPQILSESSDHLARLLKEIHERQPLADDGRIEQKNGVLQ